MVLYRSGVQATAAAAALRVIGFEETYVLKGGKVWAYSGRVAFTDVAHIRGSTTFRLEGDFSIA
jgi:hypothetical protein